MKQKVQKDMKNMKKSIVMLMLAVFILIVTIGEFLQLAWLIENWGMLTTAGQIGEISTLLLIPLASYILIYQLFEKPVEKFIGD